jgi:autotransporter-associated beta strand protein
MTEGSRRIKKIFDGTVPGAIAPGVLAALLGAGLLLVTPPSAWAASTGGGGYDGFGGNGGAGNGHGGAGGGPGGATPDNGSAASNGDGGLGGITRDGALGFGGAIGLAGATVTGTTITGGTGGTGGSDPGFAGGGGGGGGAGVYSGGAPVNNNGLAITGGLGGLGGNGNEGGGGGGGGSGLTSGGGGTAIVNNGSFAGGQGGDGGSLGSLPGGGGGGGDGVLLSGGGARLTNNGTMTGGNGGAAGNGNPSNDAGGGGGGFGLEIASDGNVIVNIGTIIGGLSGQSGPASTNGIVRANAVQINGAGNTFELEAGSAITGNIVASGSGNIFVLGGNTTDGTTTIDVSTYSGFDQYQKTDASTWTLTGTTAVVTPWTLTAGTLAVSQDGNLGAAAGTLTFNGGTLEATTGFSSTRAVALAGNGVIQTDSGTLALSGTISGAGALTKTGSGTLALTGANIYTGGTVVDAGTLTLGAGGSLAPTGAVNLADTGTTLEVSTGSDQTIGALSGAAGSTVLLGSHTLSFGDSTNQTFSGTIAGTGGIVKQGTGTETLESAQTYTGNTRVNAGTLAVNGSIVGAVNVVGSGTLTGTGAVGATTIASGGTLLAGTPGSALSVNGSLTLASGSNYNVTATTAGVSEAPAVIGNLLIADGSTLTLNPESGNYSPGTKLSVLTYTGTEAGAFSTVHADFAYLAPTVSYDAGAVMVTLNGTQAFIATGFALMGSTRNQLNAAQALTSIFNAGGTPLTAALLTASTDETSRALTQVSGDEAVAFRQIAQRRMDQAQGIVSQRLDDRQANHPANDLWVQASYQNTRQSGDDSSGASAYLDRSAALTIGYDRAIDPDWRVGVAMMANDDTVAYENRDANGRIDGAQALLYGTYAPAQSLFFVKGVASYGWWENTGNPHGSFDTTGESLYVETGLNLNSSLGRVQPYIGAQIGRYQQQAFSEGTASGAGSFDQSYDEAHTTSGSSLVGVRLGQTASWLGHALDWQADLAWRHRFGPASDTLNASFADASAYQYQIEGTRADRDEAQAGLSATYAFSALTSVYVRVGATVGAQTSTYGGFAGAQWKW